MTRKLSVITTAYKKEDVINIQIDRICRYLTANYPDFELIVVIDGEVDDAGFRVQSYIEESGRENIKLFSYERNRGKGYAMKYGLERASGELIAFIDADTDVKVRSLDVALKRMLQDDVDVVTPSKYHKDSEIGPKTPKRVLYSIGLKTLSAILLGMPKGVNDVSCGLKIFKKEVLMKILPFLTIDRFAIDSEIFFWLKKVNAKVAVVPFYAFIKGRSTSARLDQILIMVRDLIALTIKLRVKGAAYDINSLINPLR